MNAILLAAGYGTRLYPLTKNRAKPLLEVGGRPIIDYLVDRLDAAPQIERMLLVSNDRFYGDFEEWAAGCGAETPIDLYNDGSTSNEDRLGAVADVQFALDAAGISGEPAYVLATDNLPRFDLTDIIDLWQEKGASAVFTLPVDDPAELKQRGVAELGDEGRIVSFEEKPERPRGNYRVPPFYCYTAEAADLIQQFLDEGNDPDAPGHFLAWLVPRRAVYARVSEQGTYDIGTLESYRRVREQFGEGPQSRQVPDQG